MNTQPQPVASDADSTQSWDIRAGYQAAVTLLAYEGQLAWSALVAFAPLLLVLFAGAVIDRFPLLETDK